MRAVQDAFRDVRDALVNLDTSEHIYAAAHLRENALAESLRLATLRYERGYSSYQDLLEAQHALLKTQSALIDTERARFAAMASLFKAVGGGWEAPATLARR